MPCSLKNFDCRLLLRKNSVRYHYFREAKGDKVLLTLCSRDDFTDDSAMNIRQTEISTGITIGQLFVIES